MLVVTRKLGEEIQIGDEIKVTIVEIHRHSVRLGIEAPRDVRVPRIPVAELTQVPEEEESLRLEEMLRDQSRKGEAEREGSSCSTSKGGEKRILLGSF